MFRRQQDGQISGDTIGLASELLVGAAQLELVMKGGERCDRVTLVEARCRAADALEALPQRLREIDPATAQPPYAVSVSQELTDLAARIQADVTPQRA